MTLEPEGPPADTGGKVPDGGILGVNRSLTTFLGRSVDSSYITRRRAFAGVPGDVGTEESPYFEAYRSVC